MHRFYMTPETRQAVIAESNRLIAHRAALSASRREDRTAFRSWEDTRPAAFGDHLNGDEDPSASHSESAFARLVSELQSLPR
jgi:hypothetical protein